MASLYFKYSSMNGGKTIDLLKTAFNYNESGKNVLVFTSALDNRFGTGVVASRIGLRREAIALNKEDDPMKILLQHLVLGEEIDCILVDESHLLTETQIFQFSQIVDIYDIPVLCYGIRTDFQTNLFPGSAALLRYADRLEEIKSMCVYCDKKAIMVLRMENGLPVYEGEQVKIGGNESYAPVCRYHYFHPELKEVN